MKGFKAMLSDRLPITWEMALLKCGAKLRWIDRVYEVHLRHLHKSIRAENVKFLTGGDAKSATFMETVDPDGLMFCDDNDQYRYWIAVRSWVWNYDRRLPRLLLKPSFSVNDVLRELNVPHVNKKIMSYITKNNYYNGK